MEFNWLKLHPTGRDLQREVRRFILSAPCIGVSVFVATYLAVFTPGGTLASQPLWLRIVLHNSNIIVFLGWTYAWLPALFRISLRRNWSILILQTVSYIPPILLVMAAFTLLEGSPLWSSAMFINSSMLFLLIILTTTAGHLLFWIYSVPKSDGLIVEPDLVPAPETAPPCALQPHLAVKIRGRVLRMLAENQYVRVFTEAGEDLVRLSLSEAENLVPTGDGLRIHRSHWIAKDRIEAFKFEGGNPRLTTVDGEVFPVSRGKVEDLRDMLTSRETV